MKGSALEIFGGPEKTVHHVSSYFDSRKVGCTGTKGFRKTTDLSKLTACIDHLLAAGFVNPASTKFVDLGCGDGRVNFLMSYFVKISIGIEIDGEILAEFKERKNDVLSILSREGGHFPPENLFLFHGSSLDHRTFERVLEQTGVRFEDVDLFYTYITLHDVFAELIEQHGRPGALYLVYGFNRVLPRYDSFELVLPDLGSQGIAALFRKKG